MILIISVRFNKFSYHKHVGRHRSTVPSPWNFFHSWNCPWPYYRVWHV